MGRGERDGKKGGSGRGGEEVNNTSARVLLSPRNLNPLQIIGAQRGARERGKFEDFWLFYCSNIPFSFLGTVPTSGTST